MVARRRMRVAALCITALGALAGCGGASGSDLLNAPPEGGTSAPDATESEAAPSDDASGGDAGKGDATLPVDAGEDAQEGDASDASDAPCAAACVVGTTECMDGGVETCQEEDGCPAWVATTPCGAHQTCTPGTGAASACTCEASPCTTAGTVCQDAVTELTCAKDQDGCLYVAKTTSCAPGSCSGVAPNAACAATCTDSCSQSAPTACISGGLATCTLGSNGCWAYGAPVTCPSVHQTCEGAAGSAACTCTVDPLCQGAASACSNGSTQVTCAQDAQGCWYEATKKTCDAGTFCTGGSCKSGCIIAGSFYAAGTADPANACESCVPASSTSAWTPSSDGTICALTTDAGPSSGVCRSDACEDECFINGTFYASGAVNPAESCEVCYPPIPTTWTFASPDATCTLASGGNGTCNAGGVCFDCTPGASCVPADSCRTGTAACDDQSGETQCQATGNVADGTACGTNATCSNGSCLAKCTVGGKATTCGVGMVCESTGGTASFCLPGCSIGGMFYGPGRVNPSNACEVCAQGESTSGWSPEGRGTACTGGDGGTGYCDGTGTCLTCGVDCSPTGSCQTAVIACEGTDATCTVSGNQPDGTACGSGGKCSSGVCIH